MLTPPWRLSAPRRPPSSKPPTDAAPPPRGGGPPSAPTPAAAGASPFTDPRYLAKGGKAEYHRGDCPVADDLYSRTIGLSLNQWNSAKDCDNIAKALNKVLSAYCTADANGAKWL